MKYNKEKALSMQINICNVISCVTAEFCQQCLNIKGSVILGITWNVFRIPLQWSFSLIFKYFKHYDGIILSLCCLTTYIYVVPYS
jgi:hypothetical protein